MENKVINVAKDFSRYPAGRYVADGPFTGEAFREKLLLPAIRNRNGGKVIIDFDGTRGCGSSFLEEAFAGLVRNAHFKASELLEILDFKSDDSSLTKEIVGYIQDQEKEGQTR